MFEDIFFIYIHTLEDAYRILDTMAPIYQGRAYHNTMHVSSMLQSLGEYDEINQNFFEWQALCYAILFHDVVYDTHRNDNEEKAALAWQVYAKNRLSNELVELVTDVILMTAMYLDEKKRHVFLNNPLMKKFAYLDLAIIIRGSYEELIAFEHAIRKEYDWVSWDEYKRERIFILEKLDTFIEEVFFSKRKNDVNSHCFQSIKYLNHAERDFHTQ